MTPDLKIMFSFRLAFPSIKTWVIIFVKIRFHIRTEQIIGKTIKNHIYIKHLLSLKNKNYCSLFINFVLLR